MLTVLCLRAASEMHIRLPEALWEAGCFLLSCCGFRFLPALEADGEWEQAC